MSSSYRVRITEQAKEQLAEIVSYISNKLCSPASANNLICAFERGIEALSSSPETNQLVIEEPWHSKGIRRIAVKNFLVYYITDSNKMTVDVFAVVYARRD